MFKKLRMKYTLGCLMMAMMLLCMGCGGAKTSDAKSDIPDETENVASEPGALEQSRAVSEAPENQDLSAFVPEGFEILDSAFGDLNLDAHEDAIMVLKNKEEVAHSEQGGESMPRPVMILTRKADKSWELAGRNDNVALGVADGGVFGDPWGGISIKNGYFSLEHYGGSSWRWTRIITFKYDPAKKGWFLHKDGGDSFNVNEPEVVETNVRTTKDFGIVKFSEYDVDETE
jgi:hypothetical protein